MNPEKLQVPGIFNTLAVAIFLFGASAAAADLEQVFAKGSEWHLYIDDWDGMMVLQGVRSSSASSDTKVLSGNVVWKNQTGKLEVREYSRDPRREVEFMITTPSGEKIEAEGFVARDSDSYMAGVTRYKKNNTTYSGAWYAKRQGSVAAKELSVSGGFVSSANVGTVEETCRLSGGVGGLTQYVKSAWLKAQSGGREGIEAPLDSNGRFQVDVPAGRYRFGLIARGKVDLMGIGLDQEVDCPAGGNMRVAAQINGINE